MTFRKITVVCVLEGILENMSTIFISSTVFLHSAFLHIWDDNSTIFIS